MQKKSESHSNGLGERSVETQADVTAGVDTAALGRWGTTAPDRHTDTPRRPPRRTVLGAGAAE